jgi:hypothetical protein
MLINKNTIWIYLPWWCLWLRINFWAGRVTQVVKACLASLSSKHTTTPPGEKRSRSVLGVLVHTCNATYSGCWGRWIASLTTARETWQNPSSKNFFGSPGVWPHSFMLARHPSSLLCSGYSGLQASYLTLFTIAGMTGTCHHAQLFSTEMESHKHFCLGLPGTSVILISAPQVAEITVMTYQHPASK